MKEAEGGKGGTTQTRHQEHPRRVKESQKQQRSEGRRQQTGAS